MTILCYQVWDRQILRETGQEYTSLNPDFDDRENFFHHPNPSVRAFLNQAVQAGHLPNKRSPHDSISVTDTEIAIQIEWLDADVCQSYVQLRRDAGIPALKSIEMRII